MKQRWTVSHCDIAFDVIIDFVGEAIISVVMWCPKCGDPAIMWRESE